jgi:hypothetical protein
MQEAVDTLIAKFQSSASVLITYSRGAMILADVSATVGRTPYDVMSGEIMTAYESRDYMILKADLISAGVQIVPASGDLITEADGRVYEVSVPQGLYLYESIGPSGTVYKIHTKAVA